MRRAFLPITALVLALSMAVPADAQYRSNSSDIVAVATEAGVFNTLLAAAEAAGLVDLLRSEGPFTIFAPTDEAFAALPEGTVESLLENPDALRDILLYHVVSGKVMAADVVKLDRAETAQGSWVSISTYGETVRIDDARVVRADVQASNGVIHVIDAVILPTAN
jgi:uncharacterized surface protein with fasciclin (FAS1) repeats